MKPALLPLLALPLLGLCTALYACNTPEAPAPAAEVAQPLVEPQAPEGAAVAPTAQPAAAAHISTASAAGAGFTQPAAVATHAGAAPQVPAQGAAAPASTRGPAVSGTGFITWLEASGNYTAGSAGQIQVVLEAQPPFKCNEEYPYKFTFGPPPSGVSYPSPVVKGMQISEARSTLSLPIQATAAGQATVKGVFSFSVCTDDKCLVEKRDLSIPIQVN